MSRAGPAISARQVAVYHAIRDHGGDWLSREDVAKLAGTSLSLASTHLETFRRVGIAKRSMTYPSHRFKLNPDPDAVALAYIAALDEAAEILKEESPPEHQPLQMPSYSSTRVG